MQTHALLSIPLPLDFAVCLSLYCHIQLSALSRKLPALARRDLSATLTTVFSILTRSRPLVATPLAFINLINRYPSWSLSSFMHAHAAIRSLAYFSSSILILYWQNVLAEFPSLRVYVYKSGYLYAVLLPGGIWARQDENAVLEMVW